MTISPVHLLLIDDDEDDYVITRDLLDEIETTKYVIDWANTFDKGIERISSQHHDVCLLDYRLGEHNGLDLLKAPPPAAVDLPIIVLTGQGDHDIDLETMRLGAADYLIKGELTPSILEHAIRYAIDRKHSERQLVYAKQEIEAVFDSITDPTCVVDVNRNIVRVNQAFARRIKRDQEHILGQPCAPLFNDASPNIEALLTSSFQTGKPSHEEIKSAEGILKSHCFPIIEANKVCKIVLRIQDVTTEKEFERRLRQAEKMASVGQLSSGIAHEMDTPIGLMMPCMTRLNDYARELAQFLEESHTLHHAVLDGSLDNRESCERHVELCNRFDIDFLVGDIQTISAECLTAAKRIRKILDDLTEFSRPSPVKCDPEDVNGTLDNCLNVIENETSHCQIVRDYGDIPLIRYDRQQLNQVFVNLLLNAAQAIAERGVITLKTRLNSDHILISISDTGIGVAQEDRERIFDPFYTSKLGGNNTGLGLHMAASIVRAHHGELRVESTPGIGSTFSVELPTQIDSKNCC